MKQTCRKLFGLFLFFPYFLQAQINMPGLTDASTIAGAQEFQRIYSSYAKALSKYYGQASVLTSHLTFPFGQDNMGSFPGFYVGLGVGTAFSNTKAMKADSDPAVSPDVLPSKLPTLGITFNVGVALTPRWDLRVTFFPPVSLSIPSTSATRNLSGSVSLGNVRTRASYLLKKDKPFGLGVSLAGFIFYNYGKINIKSPTITTTSYAYNGGVVNTFSYDVSTTAKWKYVGGGGEVRLWWNLVVVHPYVGMSLDMQSGSFTSAVDLTGTIDVTGVVNESSTGSIGINEDVKIPFFGSRLILGMEFNLIFMRLGVEAQVEINTRLMGIGAAAGFQF
ncbi:MAG: hypothetical protein D6767_03580 [Candidatus Hydrogenedentota bacterium]|nr:MAG: hypothetical protein D6767_03580 [Candidatus Hydrogenedentota bacterium]